VIIPAIVEVTFDICTVPEALGRKLSIFVGCKAYHKTVTAYFGVTVGDDFVDSFVAGPNVISIIAEGFAIITDTGG
jgi:hypothetical protein